MLTLYSTPLSANGRKVIAVSRQLGLELDIQLVNVYRGEGRTAAYLAVNPSGKIPTLLDDALTLYESNAIMQYLCEAHGDSRLWSSDPKMRALIARWLYWECGHWQPVLTRILSPCVGHRLLPEVMPSPRVGPDWDAAELQPLLGVLGKALSDSTFLVGPEVSIADFAVAGMVTYFRYASFPFKDHPQVMDWYARIESLDGWRASEDSLWSV
jgi:glutathione S-transferase